MPYHFPQWDSRWQALYRAAIFGQNLSSAERLIAEAEAAIAIREKELTQSSGAWADAEREGMEDALYSKGTQNRANRLACRLKKAVSDLRLP